MTNSIFSAVNLLALSSWVLLVVFPRRRFTELVASQLAPALLCVAYAAVVVTLWGRIPGGFSSLAAVRQLFDNPWMLLAGWIHYLAFDLFVGSWIVRDARNRGIAHGLLLPLLPLTFMFGPAGYLSYLTLRAAVGKPVAETASYTKAGTWVAGAEPLQFSVLGGDVPPLLRSSHS